MIVVQQKNTIRLLIICSAFLVAAVLLPGCRHKTTTIVEPVGTSAMPMQHVDSTNVVQLLLTEFSGWTGKDSSFIEWKPVDSLVAQLKNISTEPGVLLNDQGYCRTRIDSVFSMQLNNNKYIIQLLSTYGMVNDTQVMDCHACSPALGAVIFQLTDSGKLKPVTYKPFIAAYGNSGEGGNVALLQYDSARYALQVSSVNTAQGYTNVSTSLYSIGNFKKLVTYEAHNDNSDAALDESMAYANDCTPHFSNEDGKIILTLVTDGTTMRSKSHKVVPFHSEKRFVYDAGQEEFVPDVAP